MPRDEIVTVRDASGRIGLSPGRVRDLVRKGDIRVKRRQGPLMLLDPGDVEREAEKRRERRRRSRIVERM